MQSIEKSQQQAQEILKTQFILIKQLIEVQTTGDNHKLQKIIDTSKQNQEQIQELQKEQNIAVLEIQLLQEDKKEFNMVLKNQKQQHSQEIAKLNQDIVQLKDSFKISLNNLQNKWQSKCNDHEQIQKKNDSLLQEQAKKLKQIQEQQTFELENIDKILKEKENQILLIEKEKREQEKEFLIKQNEQKKALLVKKEPQKQTINNIEDINQIEKDVDILEIQLRWKNISDQGAQYIGEGIKELKNLTNFNLDLYISDQGAQYIGEGIKELKNLTNLNLNLWQQKQFYPINFLDFVTNILYLVIIESLPKAPIILAKQLKSQRTLQI
ncbi:hypothetical protein PPERSA_08703 [Pseudocohnilembus persalinus]|uniref:Uncharacterized protein n=1 Tax=Pseudocohnilembus persalinus TaxID=266149 RepID=A0A0V0R898_PSEPJ|nr:hypothetical protein PPERSA_08703 [Pseudocohnilembus persalinus]|eukprot:KRX10708.1 hypothetical protein PPERSA_08703 [Pseudocohnilembus persalinus]